VSGACGCQRLEAEMSQESGGSHIPRIRDDKGALSFVEGTKYRSFFCLSFHWTPRDFIVRDGLKHLLFAVTTFAEGRSSVGERRNYAKNLCCVAAVLGNLLSNLV
jgi:hypothetical protein